jgi:hypothetical protein
MSRQTTLLSRAAKALGEAADQTPARAPSREARSQAIAAMEAALRARAAQKRRRAWYGRAAIAASMLLGALGAERMYARAHATALGAAPSAMITNGQEIVATGRDLAGAAAAFRNGRPVPFDGAQLASGDRVITQPDAHAEISLSTGTSVVLAPSADVTFARQARVQTFGLAAGAVRAKVAKLHDGERFLVRTNDTEVEVRGTVFEVSLVPPDPSCGGGTPTRVRVSEGVVVVRNRGAEARVAAGEQWPLGCAGAAAAKATSSIAAPAATVAPVLAPTVAIVEPKSAASVVTPRASATAVRDGLAAKNDLFSSALAAKRRGDLRTALSGFDAYLAQYPGGELAENAAAQRMGILARLEPARATTAARDYLARWPKGFAREEARSLTGAAEPPATP